MSRTEPTLEQWKELHEVAQNIKKLAPWDYLYDQNWITLQLPGRDEPVYCSVMGAAGECYGIGIYPGNASVSRLLRMANPLEGEPEWVHMFMQNCIVCFFGDREEVEPEDRAVMKELDIKYRGRGQWIYFRASREGCAPYFIDREDAALAIEALQNFCMAMLQYLKGELKIDFDHGEMIYRFYDKKKDMWYTTGAKWPEPLYFSSEIYDIDNEEFLAEMRQAKKTKRRLELDIPYLPMPTPEEKGGVPRCPQIFFAADADSRQVLTSEMHMPGDDSEAVEIFLDFLEDWINENGRPKTIHTRSMFTGVHLYDFCEKLEIELKMDGVPVIDEMLGTFMEGMGRMFGGFDD